MNSDQNICLVTQVTLSKIDYIPSYRFRYVDDTFVIMPHGPQAFCNNRKAFNCTHNGVHLALDSKTLLTV